MRMSTFNAGEIVYYNWDNFKGVNFKGVNKAHQLIVGVIVEIQYHKESGWYLYYVLWNNKEVYYHNECMLCKTFIDS